MNFFSGLNNDLRRAYGRTPILSGEYDVPEGEIAAQGAPFHAPRHQHQGRLITLGRCLADLAEADQCTGMGFD